MIRRQQFGVLTFLMPPYQTIEREWQWAEQLGFDQGWIPESWTMSGRSYLEPWTVLAALARATTSLRLGTLVAILVSRHPTLLAGHVVAVDQVSEGRVELGIARAMCRRTAASSGHRSGRPVTVSNVSRTSSSCSTRCSAEIL